MPSREFLAADGARRYLGLSWPLVVGGLVYLVFVANGAIFFRDGDTYWHIAAGQWILEHGAVPAHDPYSFTMRGAPWTAHEWLSEVLLALAHDYAGWGGVVALTALAFAGAIALLMRYCLVHLPPVHVLMFAALAILLCLSHLHARPHVLVMPLMVVWVAHLARASEANRAPSYWLLPLMVLWANLHGSFTFGLVLTAIFALEGVLAAWKNQTLRSAILSWGGFLLLAIAAALLTPHGVEGVLFTSKIFGGSYMLATIAEWQPTSFQYFQPLGLWLMAGLAVVLHQGIRLPWLRIVLVLMLLYMALRHARNAELVGLLAPLVLAAPLSAYWQRKPARGKLLAAVNAFFDGLARPASRRALAASAAVLSLSTYALLASNPPQPKPHITPAAALAAARQAGLDGPVLNAYVWGGYLIYKGIPVYIDGRADMYGDEFLKEYLEALAIKTATGLETLLDRHRIQWTLLGADTPAVSMLDHLPGWQRLHADDHAVVHIRRPPEEGGS